MIIIIHSLNNAPGKRETIKPGNKTRVFGTVSRGLKVVDVPATFSLLCIELATDVKNDKYIFGS